MTAASAFAPVRRNSFLQRHQPVSPDISSRYVLGVSILLTLLRVWEDPKVLSKILRLCRRQLALASQRLVASIPSPMPFIKERTSSLSTVQKERDTQTAVLSFRENQRLIHQVLQFWFGQYTPEESQKKLWMIAASSVSHKLVVDQQIVDSFGSLLLKIATDESFRKEWCCGELHGMHGKVAAIVLLDQFSRHAHRHYQREDQTCENTKLPQQQVLDRLALSISEQLMQEHKQELECGMLALPMHIFALMPFRHASTLESVQYVQETVEKCAGMHGQLDDMLRRFRKATNRRMAVLQDQARRTGTLAGSPTISATSEMEFRDEEILEATAYEADMTPSSDHIVHKTVRDFLAEQGIHKDPAKSSLHPVIVSLSGGVDSMVLVMVLAHLKNACGYSLDIVAVHIDYANRPESAAEAEYVRKFCEKLSVTFRCRRIDEVTRGVTARDEYERISREARYSTYRETVRACRERLGVDSSTKVGVMLGHHRGDLRENVLSNSHKGCGPLDLSGMTPVSQNDGVFIFRPLLPLEKKDIFHYAHTFGVPYFKDTTPHWSTRGKLRNKLLPLLEEIYGEGSMNNLSSLATESDECRRLFFDSLLAPFLKQVVRKPMGIMFGTSSWKDQSLFFWKMVLRETLHNAGLGMFSDKSVASFLERIQVKKLRSGWLQCRKDYGVYLRQDGMVFVLFPDSFPWRKAEFYTCVGQTVGYGRDNSKKVGPWTVIAEIVEKADLEKKAVPSMEAFMEGVIEYDLVSPTWRQGESEEFHPKPLVFVSEFSKRSRPQGWKKADMKIQSTLPLLGLDDAELDAGDTAKTGRSQSSFVRVRLIRDSSQSH